MPAPRRPFLTPGSARQVWPCLARDGWTWAKGKTCHGLANRGRRQRARISVTCRPGCQMLCRCQGWIWRPGTRPRTAWPLDWPSLTCGRRRPFERRTEMDVWRWRPTTGSSGWTSFRPPRRTDRRNARTLVACSVPAPNPWKKTTFFWASHHLRRPWCGRQQPCWRRYSATAAWDCLPPEWGCSAGPSRRARKSDFFNTFVILTQHRQTSEKIFQPRISNKGNLLIFFFSLAFFRKTYTVDLEMIVYIECCYCNLYIFHFQSLRL